ncbi:ABC transporter G family member 43-like [Magnolia sinica]|uniref:ABC transporter G family member 43-like n=1 Tax=Magnolia sinica TaxID=86752 RepID=UPI002657BCE5|nr:ABC transporter G family member 43-like [Magnolia sinica]
MSFRSMNSPSEIVWWIGDQPVFASKHSPTASPNSSNYSGMNESVIVVPARGTKTPTTRAKMPGISSCSSPEILSKIENASPDTAKRVAVQLYGRLKSHGLREEARDAVLREDRGGEGLKGDDEEKEEERKKIEELLGMEYLLKDGFVSYLRDMVRITPPIPQQVVRFSGIKYSRKFEISSDGYATFGNKLLGCFFAPLRSLFRRKNTTELQILKGVDGYVMPGSITLLLGPPGAKSSLLETIAGKVRSGKSSVMEGDVTYNDKSASDIRLSRLIAYVSGQLNKHIPLLSVRETLEFARDCTQGLRPENFTPQMRKFFAHALVEGQDPFLEYVLQILGLKGVEHELAGEAISDTDRQKLTTAELALGTYSIMLYDQPFSGSDPAATYDLVDTIRTISRIQQSSAVMSLTQLSQEVFDLFDRIILLGDGHVLFQGPRQDAIPYFANLGYLKPSHVESGEFLEDIVAGEGSQYLAQGANPLSLDELAECYKSSDHHLDVMRIVKGEDVTHTYWIESEPGLGLSLKTPSKYDSSISPEPRREMELVVAKLSSKVGHSGGIESTGRVQVGDLVTGISINNEELRYLAVGSKRTRHERVFQVYSMLRGARGHVRLQVERYKEEEDEYQSQWNQFQRPFVQTWWKSTKTLIRRQLKITKRLHMLIKLRLFQAIILGVFAGTLFYKLGGQYKQQSMNSVRALGFVSTMSIMLINLVQLPLYMLQRPIFYKHRSQRFFRASSYTVAHCVVNLPQTFIEALAYTVCIYFPVGLSLEGNGLLFFYYLILLFLVAYFGSSVFFFLGAISSIPEVGNALAGLIVSIFLLFSGFVIYPSNIPLYWKWLVYVNPIHWANVSFCDLQFSKGYTDPCSKYLNQMPFCDQFPTMTVGKAYLAFNELSDDSGKPWLPYVILLGWTAITILSALVALKKIEFTGTSSSLPQLKKTPVISNYREDTENGWCSSDGYDEFPDKSSISKHARPRTPMSGPSVVEDVGGVGNWIEEFRLDMEWGRLGLPVVPVTLLFLDISFTRYDARLKERVQVFNSITGYAKPGTMLALLGGSKASKTTLLKCLSGRVPPDGSLNGEVQANGYNLSNAFSRVVGYVEKLDAHQPYLSVRESLLFSAGLRLDRTISSMSRHIHVELILDQLGLKLYANQLVGSLRDATGKTFEIAKKITIAVELAANPSVLFLEEPISGLDAAGISNILRILSHVSASGRIIVATLTHPNARALSFFHQALILTQDSRQGYFGPIGFNCNELLIYFTSIPKVPQYFQTQSPITFAMGALGLGIKRRGTPLADFAEIYQSSSLCGTNRKEISSIKRLNKQWKLRTVNSTYPTPYIRQAGLVLLRTQRFLWRNVQYTYGRLIGCVMIGLLMGSLYFQIEYRDIYGVTSRTLYIYMQIILIGVISANNVIPQIGTDRLVYFRERRAGMYLPIFYPVSWAVGEIPYFLIATLAVVGIGNGMAGIATGTASEFLVYWLTLFVFTVCVTYFGMMLTFLAPVPTLAAFATSIVTSIWVSASGVVVVFSDIKFYKWVYWSNPFQFAMNALTSISFFCETKKCGLDCRCPRLPDGSYVWDRLASTRALSKGRIDLDMATLAGMCVLFAGLAFLFFVLLKHNSPPLR